MEKMKNDVMKRGVIVGAIAGDGSNSGGISLRGRDGSFASVNSAGITRSRSHDGLKSSIRNQDDQSTSDDNSHSHGEYDLYDDYYDPDNDLLIDYDIEEEDEEDADGDADSDISPQRLMRHLANRTNTRYVFRLTGYQIVDPHEERYKKTRILARNVSRSDSILDDDFSKSKRDVSKEHNAKHVAYIVKVSEESANGIQKWTISKRYSQFYELKRILKQFFTHTPKLPKKTWSLHGNFDFDFISKRAKGISTFLWALASDPRLLFLHPVVNKFLHSDVISNVSNSYQILSPNQDITSPTFDLPIEPTPFSISQTNLEQDNRNVAAVADSFAPDQQAPKIKNDSQGRLILTSPDDLRKGFDEEGISFVDVDDKDWVKKRGKVHPKESASKSETSKYFCNFCCSDENQTEEKRGNGNEKKRRVSMHDSSRYNKDSDENIPDLPVPKLRIVIIVVGSRGDVQPYIALGKGLKEKGHFVRIVAHSCFDDFVKSQGLDFATISGDPKQLLEMVVKHSMFSFQFVKEGLNKHRRWITEIMYDAWDACTLEEPEKDRHIRILSDIRGRHLRMKSKHTASAATANVTLGIHAASGSGADDDEGDIDDDNDDDYQDYEISEDKQASVQRQVPKGTKRPGFAFASRRSSFRADLVIANPPAFSGWHIAEALGIPLIMTFPMPWTRTTAFASPFTSSQSSSGRLNWMSYGAVDRLMWLGAGDLINSFRSKVLRIPPIWTMSVKGHRYTHDYKVPWLYPWSPHLLPKPDDWGKHICVSGYWFLDDSDGKDWTPAEELKNFLFHSQYNEQGLVSSGGGKPIVFIGFGSIVIKDSTNLNKELSKAAVELVNQGVMLIVQQGWTAIELDLSELDEEKKKNVIVIGPAPHKVLFKYCSVVVHHGGSGTTAEGLKNGVPTVVVPFFGDQFFWGRTVEEQKAGCCIPNYKLNSRRLIRAITTCLTSEYKMKAEEISKGIMEENGIENAIKFIEQKCLPASGKICRDPSKQGFHLPKKDAKIQDRDESTDWRYWPYYDLKRQIKQKRKESYKRYGIRAMKYKVKRLTSSIRDTIIGAVGGGSGISAYATNSYSPIRDHSSGTDSNPLGIELPTISNTASISSALNTSIADNFSSRDTHYQIHDLPFQPKISPPLNRNATGDRDT